MWASWLALGLLTALPIVIGDSLVDLMPLDRTRQSGSAGSKVIDAVTSFIDASCVFPNDKRFMRRLAYVESGDGSDEKTFRADYDGGIWQVNSTVNRLKLTVVRRRDLGVKTPLPSSISLFFCLIVFFGE